MARTANNLDVQNERALTDDQINWIRELLADFLSVDIITAKGDVTMTLDLKDTFLAKATPPDNKILILARTIMQFGGDQLMIIPTSNAEAGGSIGTLNQEIWNLHKENVAQALERRKDNLATITDIVELIARIAKGGHEEIWGILSSMRHPTPP